jgi:DNA-binding CsgD family transcriptional regulator
MHQVAFVGRREEVVRLHAALGAAREGSGSLVLICGEAGIGKTSLAQEISRAAAWLGTPATWGPALEGEGTPPYWAWRQVMGALRRLVQPGHTPDFERIEPETSPFVLYEAVVEALHSAAGREGLLVVLDDLHWADAGSLRLLQLAAAQVPASRILILGTYREPGAADGSPLAHALPALLRERAVQRIRLRGLDPGESEALLAQVMDRPPTQSLARRIHEQTEGNPFYLVELAEEIHAGDAHPRLPQSLREIARRRLALVGADCRRVLALAAVIGRDFDIEQLAEAANQPPAVVLGLLGEAGGVGLVESVAPQRQRFAHALLREALYLDLPTGQRAEAHGRVGRMIASLPPARRRERLDALAHHLRQALPFGDAAQALDVMVEAGEAAEAELAYEQAADRYEEAVELAARAPDGSHHSRARLLVKLARCQQRAGAAVQAASERAAEAARADGDRLALAEAALVVRVLLEPRAARSVMALCAEALAALDGSDPVLEARLQAQMSLAAALAGEEAGKPSLASRALENARRIGDPEARYLALQAREWEITGSPERAQERWRLSQEAVAVARESADPAQAVWAHSWRLGTSWELGLRGEADEELAALEIAVEQLKEPAARWRLEVARSSLALIDGRYADAVASADRAVEIAQRGGFGSAAGVLRALAAVRTGDDPIPAELRQEAQTRFWYAGCLADQDRITELRELWTGGAGAAGSFTPDLWLIATANMVKIAVALEDRDWAAQLYEQLAPYPELHVVRGPLGSYEGPVALYCGRLAMVLGRPDEAQAFFEQAIVRADRIGSPPFEAIARHQLARVLRRRGRLRDLGAAMGLLDQARATAERLGMRPLAAAVAADLDLLRHPRGRRTPLSDRELEVATLVADGLTNRAIGERLHISERTAENHVRNIMDRLGLDSRAQIAAWSAQARNLST